MSLGHGTSIVRSGLVLHLDAANPKSYPGSGTVWADLSGNGNNATLVNGMGYSSTYKGYLVQDNTDDYVNTNYTAPTSNFTISMWGRRTSTVYWSVLWANETYNSALGYMAIITASNNLYFGKSGAFAPTVTIPDSSAWSYYTFSLDASGNYNTYHNGALLNTRNSTVSASIPQTIKIGTRHNNAGTGYTDTRYGHCSLFTTYNRVLSSVEIQQNFEATRGRYDI
jgi:hypothetical protein